MSNNKVEICVNGFGARAHLEGTTEISFGSEYFVVVRNEKLEALGMHYRRGHWYPAKVFNAFVAGIKAVSSL